MGLRPTKGDETLAPSNARVAAGTLTCPIERSSNSFLLLL
jgi:hypothetical protein